MAGYVPGLGALSGKSDVIARKGLAELEARVAALDAKAEEVRKSECARVRVGAPPTRSQAAAFLGVSTKKLQRMESAGTLGRCSGLGVRYAASDVLRLASASSRKGPDQLDVLLPVRVSRDSIASP